MFNVGDTVKGIGGRIGTVESVGPLNTVVWEDGTVTDCPDYMLTVV